MQNVSLCHKSYTSGHCLVVPAEGWEDRLSLLYTKAPNMSRTAALMMLVINEEKKAYCVNFAAHLCLFVLFDCFGCCSTCCSIKEALFVFVA